MKNKINCYNKIFKSLYCDGHCGRKCDPSQRIGNNTWRLYYETCRKKRENPNLPPEQKNVLIENEIDSMKKKIEASKKEYNKIKNTYHDYSCKLQNFYDIIVDIDSLRNIIKGWKVKFSEVGKKIMIL